jgi:hypothetical protein
MRVDVNLSRSAHRYVSVISALAAIVAAFGCARDANHRAPVANATPDAVIERLRHRFVGHDVYGYGGIAISCPPQWTRFYGPAIPIRVTDVQREHAYTTLATGGGNRVYGPGFDDSHAVRFVFALPHAASNGMNYQVPGIAGPCPALDLSEFQIPISLSIDPPPAGALRGGLRVGMTRPDVIWQFGYPWELGDKQRLIAERVWHYGVGLALYDIVFSADRVTEIQGAYPQTSPTAHGRR